MLDKLLDNENLLYTPSNYQQEVDDDYSPTDIARECRRVFGIPNGPIENLTEVLEDNGFFIIYRNLPKGMDGFTLLPGRNIRVNNIIILNKNHAGEQIRFSLARELGHIIMHRKLTGDIEEEANEFACEFLMPKVEIVPYLRNIKSLYDFIPIKKIWRVSVQSLLYRAKTLGILTINQYKSFNVRISQLGYRQKEPAPIPRETPNLLAELKRAYQSLGFTLPEMLQMLCISRENYYEYFTPPPRPAHAASLEHLTLVK